MITLADRLEAVRKAMDSNGIATVVAAANGTRGAGHPDTVAHLTGFRAMGDTLLVLDDRGSTLIVSPAMDAERAAKYANGGKVVGTEDVAGSLSTLLRGRNSGPVGIVGFGFLHPRLAKGLAAAIGGEPRRFDTEINAVTAIKTGAEIARARRASEIAEKGYDRLLELARPGMAECDLATQLNIYTKSLGADDNFLMLNAAPHSKFGLPASTRKMELGDTMIVELTPSYQGQFVQICRTVSIGEPRPELRAMHEMLERAYHAGIARIKPGVSVASVCGAMDAVIIAAGFGEYCQPPVVIRRGHGLGSGSSAPGNVEPDNETILEEDMLFVAHPNQYLPATGYMRVGDPVLVTATGAEVLVKREAFLGVVGV